MDLCVLRGTDAGADQAGDLYGVAAHGGTGRSSAGGGMEFVADPGEDYGRCGRAVASHHGVGWSFHRISGAGAGYDHDDTGYS